MTVETRRGVLFKNLVAAILVFTSLAVLVVAVMAYQTNQEQADQIARRDKALTESQSEAAKALDQSQVNGQQLNDLLAEVHRQNLLLGIQSKTLATQTQVIEQFRNDLSQFGFSTTVQDGRVTITRVPIVPPSPKPAPPKKPATPSKAPATRTKRTPTAGNIQAPVLKPGKGSVKDHGHTPVPTPTPTPTPTSTKTPRPKPKPTATPTLPLPLPTVSISLPALNPLPTIVPLPSIQPTCVLIMCLSEGQP